ncbi:MAG: hypothetical protein R3176_04885 [Woeseiaceae bacterium]|nr:hypothetical protein [Woeseiaceae bacterium]
MIKKPIILTALVMLLPALGIAAPACEKVVIAGETQATGPATFVGDALSNQGNLTVDVAITGSKPNADGSINATTTHTFTSGAIVFTTRDRARLVPLNDFGVFRLDTQATIVEGGWGHLQLDGVLDFATGRARWLARGEVCTG